MIREEYELFVRAAEIMLLLLLSFLSDFREAKIKNSVTLTFTGIGILTNLFLIGPKGFGFSLKGWIFPVAILFIFFFLGMLGAGDVKLFGAMGAIMGAEFTGYAMIFTFTIGGILAGMLLAARRNTAVRFKHLRDYIKCCFLSRSILPYDSLRSGDRRGMFKFAYAVVPGALAELAIQVLHQFGH